ncbi:MAG: tRNA pseudouridine(55) synthase TruB [Clostridium sp.]|nr:tRNA pseudouridine(55) synthase TruB [Clostridium sp.]MCM1444648.1 tRNA pseudouridine(55) synthase TruB [Candidatus Amulumruptor caecigallinarius]
MNGILVVNKSKGITSRDVVNSVSKLLHTKKVGHTGTLDPLATGVLVLTVGTATKLSEFITHEYKEYIAEVILGIKTDTLDITGNVLEEMNVNIEKNEIVNIILSMKGKYLQEVPLYSAIKINGKKLYEYARSGISVELPKREVEIKNINIIDNIKYENGKVYFKIKCEVSKGTYIRSLIRDIAEKLGVIGVMSNLQRTKVGDFDIESSYTLQDIENNNFNIISISKYLKFKEVVVDNENDIINGKILDNIYNEPIIFKNKSNELLAIYKVYEKDNTKIKPWKMLKKVL